ncbi:molybdate transporter family protein [Shewanella gelidii]|uniref:Sulfate transporter n=1 Tax=Shewanella gelidii TaxID=1642821 RepID=A0A917JQH4_9GAMM|nr:molybdate transporter family protein [Shewanella gelidii]MCL1097594.1 sulfate transporter [Shewanella gelidii]GGI80325.1 sulfate transporter [Shewanella gelidii]
MAISTELPSKQQQLNQFMGECSGAFADLGTFLPLVLGMIALNQFSPQAIFSGFGVFAIASGLLYRRPIPVQPMKVISALVIAQGLSPQLLQASGMLMGLILIVLAYSGALNWLAKQLSQAVSVGIQLAIGLQLLLMGHDMMLDQAWMGYGAFIVLFISRFFPLRYLAMPFIIVLGVIWQAQMGGSAILTETQLPPWQLTWPTLNDWHDAALLLVLPQLALTLTNAVIATSAIAKEKFPEDAARMTPKHFALSSGFSNLLLAPFGAAAMCHGAGGLAVQYHFGARRLWTPIIFGGSCLLVALFWDQQMASFLGLIPVAILGSLLSIAGLQLAYSKRLFDGKPFCTFVIIITTLGCLFINTAAGLIIGVAIETLHKHFINR